MDFGRYATDAVEYAYMWGLVQRFLRDSGFNAAPVHVAILDKGQRSAKGLNSGSEGLPRLPEDQSGDGETEREAPKCLIHRTISIDGSSGLIGTKESDLGFPVVLWHAILEHA